MCFLAMFIDTKCVNWDGGEQVEDTTEIWSATMFEAAAPNFGPLHNFMPPMMIADGMPRATRIFSLASVGDWSHGESHILDCPKLDSILENSHCEQPCYGFLGLLKFLCSQTLPNLFFYNIFFGFTC